MRKILQGEQRFQKRPTLGGDHFLLINQIMILMVLVVIMIITIIMMMTLGSGRLVSIWQPRSSKRL